MLVIVKLLTPCVLRRTTKVRDLHRHIRDLPHHHFQIWRITWIPLKYTAPVGYLLLRLLNHLAARYISAPLLPA